MSTLKKLIEDVALALDKTTDIPYKRRISDVIADSYAEVTRRYFDKYGRVADSFLQTIPCVNIKRDKQDPYCNLSNCSVRKSTIDIPFPTRILGEAKFRYVGPKNLKKGFTYINPGQIEDFIQYDIYSKGDPRYTYINKRIYIYNGEIDSIAIIGSFSNPFELDSILDCAGNACYVDKDIPSDVAYLVKQLTYQELGIIGKIPDNEEIQINPNDNKSL